MKAIKLPAVTAIVMLLCCRVVFSQSATPVNADTAWQELQQASKLPKPPQAPSGRELTEEQYEQFYKQVVDAATAAAAKAKAFYTQYPESSNTVPAKQLECKMLQMAFYDSMDQSARKSAFKNMASAQDSLLTDSRLTDSQRYDLRVQIAQRARQDPQLDWEAAAAKYEKNLRQLIKDYPNNDQAYDLFITFAAESRDDKARSIANEVLAEPVSDSVKNKANAILRRLDAVGKPLDIKFTALDGRDVDLSQMKGKVVLVDFWATWCGPCVGEIPHVKEAYNKFHSKGFEVVGVSFDSNKNALKDFVAGHDMPWPQYFDGEVWKNKYGLKYAIDSIPTMWLVDKNGNLFSSNARQDLQGKVEKLLAE
jgi:thiol-disulfide isomerase/thioredoxin